MRKASLLLFILSLAISANAQGFNPNNYLDQEPPGDQAKVFAPGIVSTSLNEWCITITPDYNEIYYTVTGAYASIVCIKRDADGNWGEPEVASFSGRYSDYEPMLSPDGQRIYFVSNRPLSGSGAPRDNTDIWYAEKNVNGEWGEPIHTGDMINTEKDEYYPAVASDETLYFTAERDTSLGYGIYYAEPGGDSFSDPIWIGDSVNLVGKTTGHCYIAPDESYIVYSSNGREGGVGRFDLYISFRQSDGIWTKSKNLGDKINSPGGDDYPFVSPDGKILFFTSYRRNQPRWNEKPLTYEDIVKSRNEPGNGGRDIYWIDASVLFETES